MTWDHIAIGIVGGGLSAILALSQRDKYLRAGGYCTWMREHGCRELPVGNEAQGFAIEYLANIASNNPYISPTRINR